MRARAPITATTEGEMNNLVFAVNHYLSTGDHICEGVGWDTESEWVLALVVSKTDPRDQADFERLKARVDEIRQQQGIEVQILDEHTSDARFYHYTLSVPKACLREFCQALMARPSALGWGTSKPHMDQHWTSFASQVEIARQEGVWLNSVHAAQPQQIRKALTGNVDASVLEVALQPTGEDGRPVQFWRVDDRYYLDDPTFGPPIDISTLTYDSELGLHPKRNE